MPFQCAICKDIYIGTECPNCDTKTKELKLENRINELDKRLDIMFQTIEELNDHMKLHCDQIHFIAGLVVAIVSNAGLPIPPELQEIINRGDPKRN